MLEVGGGEGELAARLVDELGVQLVGIDQSERMVEIQRSQGIDARVGDVERLPFRDAEFDTAVAAWMLYHVQDLDRALAELARVLQPGGHLVAVTNSIEHLRELWDLAGRETSAREFQFRRENGEEALRRRFARVEQRNVDGWVIMDDDAVRRYAASWEALAPAAERLPLADPLRVRRSSTIFVAARAWQAQQGSDPAGRLERTCLSSRLCDDRSTAPDGAAGSGMLAAQRTAGAGERHVQVRSVAPGPGSAAPRWDATAEPG